MVRRRGPLTPIFDVKARRGRIDVSNTPGVTPFTTDLTALLEYDSREWDGSTGDMPNQTALGATWDLPKAPGTRWQLDPASTAATFADVAGVALDTLVPSLVVAWDGFPSEADDAEVDLYVFGTPGSEVYEARIRFDVGFNVGGAGRVQVVATYRMYHFDGAVDQIDTTRTRTWLDTSGVPTTAVLIVNMDPVAGGMSAQINEVDMNVSSAGSAPVAGDSTDFLAVAGTRAFTGNNVEYDSAAGATLPLEIVGFTLTRGSPAAGDADHWATHFGISLP